MKGFVLTAISKFCTKKRGYRCKTDSLRVPNPPRRTEWWSNTRGCCPIARYGGSLLWNKIHLLSECRNRSYCAPSNYLAIPGDGIVFRDQRRQLVTCVAVPPVVLVVFSLPHQRWSIGFIRRPDPDGAEGPCNAAAPAYVSPPFLVNATLIPTD